MGAHGRRPGFPVGVVAVSNDAMLLLGLFLSLTLILVAVRSGKQEGEGDVEAS